jgi:bis(5'-nucleosyl)-tetraphosphatase (symmetrical)
LEVLRFVKRLPNTKVVLGNHDIHLLALAHGNTYPHHTLDAVLAAPDRNELISWLRHLPVLHYDATLNVAMVHAGLPPQWDLNQALQCARELETALQDDQQIGALLENLYGNQPDIWRDDLSGWERLRFITNAFTRMRYCSLNGRLEFSATGGPGTQPAGYVPWFKVPGRKHKQQKIIFGHWSALGGKTDEPRVFALDTGCVWGNTLTALRLEDGQVFSVPCRRSNSTKLKE